MYPSCLVGKVQHGEKLVYQALARMPEDWIIFHNCWEHYKKDGYYTNYEADFIVLIPGLGYAVLEVKDWPHTRIVEGVWQSRGSAPDSPWVSMGVRATPLHQAEIACRKLTRGLVERCVLPSHPARQPEHRCMAILTNSVPPDWDDAGESGDYGNLPLQDLYLCGREALETQLQHRIENLFVRRNKLGPNMSPQVVADMVAYLAPTVIFRMDVSAYLEAMEHVGASLLSVLPMLEASTGGIRVEGSAGAGKTVMACYEAVRQAEAGRERILLLCFNRNLACALRQLPMLAAQQERIIVSNFHEFCIRYILQPAGLEHLVNYHGRGDRLPQAAVDAMLELLPELPKFESIFVDEAQDFRASWWELIYGLLAPDGKFYIFSDSNQDLYTRSPHIPKLPTHISLVKNLRNAFEIAQYSAGMLPVDKRLIPLGLHGAQVCILPGNDDARERALSVSRIIAKLRRNPELCLPNEQIAVLSPWSTRHHRCSIPFIPEVEAAPPDETESASLERFLRCRKIGCDKILASTIKGFKGLEASYIILTDIIGLDESRGFDMDEFYVACTRARYGLYIVPSVNGEALARRILEDSSLLS